MSADSRPTNPYAKEYRGFLKETADHELHVLRDDGLHRHLRVQAPGTRVWSFDVITWPGHLATSGDIADGYMFRRTEDMMTFFAIDDHLRDYHSDGAPSIDFRYWAEKLCGGRSHDVKKYSPETFLQLVREILEEHEEMGVEAQAFRARQITLLERIDRLRRRHGRDGDLPSVEDRLAKHWAGEMRSSELFSYDDLSQAEMDRLAQEFDIDEDGRPAVHDLFALEWADVARQDPSERRDEILSKARYHSESEHEAHRWLSTQEGHLGSDLWELDLRDYDVHFVLACYCIDLAVQLYRRHQTGETAA